MCFILVLHHLDERWPLVLAANRDEARSRPSLPPHRWKDETPTIWAGRDKVAGGTWLGVNDSGLLAAITNRRNGEVDPSLPSRGGLCLGVLRQQSPSGAHAFLENELHGNRFNPFNLLWGDAGECWVTTW